MRYGVCGGTGLASAAAAAGHGVTIAVEPLQVKERNVRTTVGGTGSLEAPGRGDEF